MPRALKTDKFFLYKPTKSGPRKNSIFVGANDKFEGGVSNVNLQDLIEFLAKNNIDPSDVSMERFMAFIPVKKKS